MTTKYLLSVAVALLIACIQPTNEIYGLQLEMQSLEAVGIVVAYDQFVSLTNITWVPQSQVLLVRISKSIKGRAEGPYIKVVYKYAPNDSPLPQNIFDGNDHWRFTLKRDISCDSSLREMRAIKSQTVKEDIDLPRLKFKNGTEKPGEEVTLPCYVLKPGKYRMEE